MKKKISRKPNCFMNHFLLLAFKIATDPFVGDLLFLEFILGVLDAGSYVLNNRSTGKKERYQEFIQMHSNKQNAIEFIESWRYCSSCWI